MYPPTFIGILYSKMTVAEPLNLNLFAPGYKASHYSVNASALAIL